MKVSVQPTTRKGSLELKMSDDVAQLPNPHKIPSHDRLIFALDFSNHEEALAMVTHLGDSVTFYKLGLEMLVAGHYLSMAEILRHHDKKIMVDLKMFDVPETISRAVQQLQKVDATFATVHGNGSMLEAAVAAKNGVKILAVTVLTSLDNDDLQEMGFEVDVETLVLSRARRALELGCDGVISSGRETAALRMEHGRSVVIVVPGIRPVANVDDQKRTVDVEEAFNNGADYIVVGRPIRDSLDPRRKAEEIQSRIARLFA